ncbi:MULTISPECIES: dethiobiotin synthase [Lysobacter]|jgi:dethiobiotin synthetase|uniref:ATP-dependent dethiobiotin synthetase BioD n=1 Tax=Lysobacter gummosus TaxID=262324 RepID=A0ABY3XFF1_9GAMM|nr:MULTISPECIES: dethiobiotin synthase [Lysobacter]ALN89738.1 dethiobiotin synthase [Lysobacter gummosus]UJB18363.1 dethiobiotin synthase [Lysobacter capsici]UJQ27913.1 dethiobiotin synthase [Lysobacter gummosus]UNP30355.1 dethiobiotin synthase [Lysobacter gummosus]
MPPRAYLPGLFVTGTDTGVGKSVVSASLLHAIRALGARAIGMKPVASGCEPGAQGWRNEDALLLQAASDPTPRYEDVNPYALPQALAPEIAAAEAGIEIGLEPILAAYARLRAQAEVMVVEGVGGWAAPIDARLDQIDLVRALDLPVVLVVGLRLGAINHARLSARAIAADGARFIGWIANDIDPQMARMDENFEILCRRMPVPCWGRVPYSPRPDPARLAASLRPQV